MTTRGSKDQTKEEPCEKKSDKYGGGRTFVNYEHMDLFVPVYGLAFTKKFKLLVGNID
jgi:hypothetical protein